MRRLAWLACLLSALAGPAGAQDPPGDQAAGADLADDICSLCHRVAKDRPDPAVGPSFLALADDPATTAPRLRAFLQAPHGRMPDLILTPQEIEDVIVHILSLKGAARARGSE